MWNIIHSVVNNKLDKSAMQQQLKHQAFIRPKPMFSSSHIFVKSVFFTFYLVC